MAIGESITLVRKGRNMKQKELARLSGLSEVSICNIENGKVIPSKGTLEKIGEALSIPVPYLVLFSLTEEDVPEVKREGFKALMKSLKGLLIDD